MRLLVAEDEEELASAIADGLRREGIATDVALDGRDAIFKADVNRYDVILLDRELPHVHGDEVCRRLVEAGTEARILMLTAAGTIAERVGGLSLGADDYLVKPFAFAELLARIHALSRRSGPSRSPVLNWKDIEFDIARRSVSRAGSSIVLTAKEMAVLEILMSAEGGVISAEELLERAWDENVDPFTTSVRVVIANLRRKLGDPSIIETVIGAGYRLSAGAS
jgi:DNA-binding response OmpR family regulator